MVRVRTQWREIDMIDHRVPSAQVMPSPGLRLPMQVAPISRGPSPAASAAGGGGLDASIDAGDVVGTIAKFVPLAISLFSDRALKRDITPVTWSR